MFLVRSSLIHKTRVKQLESNGLFLCFSEHFKPKISEGAETDQFLSCFCAHEINESFRGLEQQELNDDKI